MPWGWSNTGGPRHAVPAQKPVKAKRDTGPVVGWPYRKEESGVTVKEYNVVRRRRQAGKQGKEEKNKHWGW